MYRCWFWNYEPARNLESIGACPRVALIILAAFLTEASIDMLLRFSNIGDAFAKIGKVLLQVCAIINNIGVLIVYLIIIGILQCFPFFYMPFVFLQSQTIIYHCLV
jgi:hypothetical protein